MLQDVELVEEDEGIEDRERGIVEYTSEYYILEVL
jgi:hypothetical protein